MQQKEKWKSIHGKNNDKNMKLFANCTKYNEMTLCFDKNSNLSQGTLLIYTKLNHKHNNLIHYIILTGEITMYSQVMKLTLTHWICVMDLPCFQFGTVHLNIKGFSHTYKIWVTNSIELGQTNRLCRLAWYYTDGTG
jgi:hypothetical protein